MTADVPRSEPQSQGDLGHNLLVSLPDATGPIDCGASCGCRLRLAGAIADAPPRPHELELLRLYLDRPETQLN